VKKKVALVVGGMGSEREVSLKTGKAFATALTKLGYSFVQIDAGPDFAQKMAQQKDIDCALLALHGKYGEDGTVQGILEYLKIPYTGSGVLASALAMNKIQTKKIIRFMGVPTADFQEVDLSKTRLEDIQIEFDFPVVVKPTREGSTVGISIVENRKDLKAALEQAAKLDGLILIEKFIKGMEVTVPIWFGKALPIIEIVPKGGFYDYEHKYTAGGSEHIIPARLPDSIRELCERYAVETFNAVDCRQYARVDIMIENNRPYVLEINTLPGCTEFSLFPESAAKAGISFEKVIERLVETATTDYPR
jgi:D-alanine-D-alanine ligase